MKTLTSILAICAIAAPVSAQALNEPFDTSTSGAFPPAGWTETNSGTTEIWVDTSAAALFAVPAGYPTADAAGHAYTGFAAIADSNLMTPIMDLSTYGAPELTYDGGLGYSAYMSHTSIYFGLSDIEVSTDGGATYASVWAEAAVVDYWTPAITLDLTGSAANQAAVGINFRYQGEFAHEWVLDNVIVDNVAPSNPVLTTTCSPSPFGTTADADIFGCTPNGPVAIAWGPTGTYLHGGSICNGVALDISPVSKIVVFADSTGYVFASQIVPSTICGSGIGVQAVDGGTCAASNYTTL